MHVGPISLEEHGSGSNDVLRTRVPSTEYRVPCTMCLVNCPCLMGPLRCVSNLQSRRVALNGAHFVRHCQLSSGIGSAQKAHGPLKACPPICSPSRLFHYNPLPPAPASRGFNCELSRYCGLHV